MATMFVDHVRGNGEAIASALQLATDGPVENDPPREEDVLRYAPLVRAALSAWPEARKGGLEGKGWGGNARVSMRSGALAGGMCAEGREEGAGVGEAGGGGGKGTSCNCTCCCQLLPGGTCFCDVWCSLLLPLFICLYLPPL